MTNTVAINLQSRKAVNQSGNHGGDDGVVSLMGILAGTIWSGHAMKGDNAWAVCLCSIALALNPRIKIHEVIEAMPYGDGEMDSVGLMNTMANLGYESHTVTTRLCDIDARLLPCLFIPQKNPDSPGVVITPEKLFYAEKKSYRRILPGSGIVGTAVFFKPADALHSDVSRLNRIGMGQSWFRAMMERFRGTLLHILAAGLVLNLIGLATPLFIMVVYDRVISSHAPDVLPFLAAGVMIAIITEFSLRVIRSRSMSWLGGRLDNIVSNWIFAHLTQLAPAYVERASIPSQIARIKTFESIRDFFSGSVFMSVLELPFMLIALVVIGIIAGPLVLVPIGVVIVYGVLFYAIWRRVRVIIRTAAKASSARQQFTLDTFDKVEAIRANGLGAVWAQKFRELSGREALSQFHLGWLGVVGETLANGLTVLSAVAVVGFGVHLIWAGDMTTGAMVATMILVWRVLNPFYSLCTMIPRLEQLRNSVRQVNTLMDVDTEEMEATGLARPGKMRGRVSVLNAGLQYGPDEDPIFTDMTFDAKPGDIVAITGENGSGKTSLLKMVKGLYPPTTGSVRLDGFDMRQLNPHDIRRNIAYIPQIPEFFHGTIGENLRFCNPLASDAEMRQGLGQANILAEIESMPDGINTIIGGRTGLRLTSSMALRLSMVRAYLQESPILLIDEMPNSLMNDDAGRFMHDTILRHRGEQTVLIVTYREDFLNMASTIVFLRRNMPPQCGPGPEMVKLLRKIQW